MNINRRDFITACGAFAATSALASPIRSGVADANISFADPEEWSNPYQTPDNSLVAMWDGLRGGFYELFGHETIESGIVRVPTGIRCTKTASISVPQFEYGDFGSFTIACCYSDFAIQSRKNLFTNVADRRGFTFFNIHNGTGLNFETYYDYQGSGANLAHPMRYNVPSSGTWTFSVNAPSATSFIKRVWQNDESMLNTSWSRGYLYNDFLSISPVLNCTIHSIRVYNVVLSDVEVSRFFEIDQERFGVGV